MTTPNAHLSLGPTVIATRCCGVPACLANLINKSIDKVILKKVKQVWIAHRLGVDSRKCGVIILVTLY